MCHLALPIMCFLRGRFSQHESCLIFSSSFHALPDPFLSGDLFPPKPSEKSLTPLFSLSPWSRAWCGWLRCSPEVSRFSCTFPSRHTPTSQSFLLLPPPSFRARFVYLLFSPAGFVPSPGRYCENSSSQNQMSRVILVSTLPLRPELVADAGPIFFHGFFHNPPPINFFTFRF